jgi:hypothetical protein
MNTTMDAPLPGRGLGRSRLLSASHRRLDWQLDEISDVNLFRCPGSELREARDLDHLNPLTQDFSID